MMKRSSWFLGSSISLLAFSGAACADAGDWSFSGMVREEIAAKTGNEQNINNWATNVYNGVPVTATGLFGPADLTRPNEVTGKYNYKKADPDFNMFATRLELNLDGKLSNDVAVHFKLRGFTDQIGEIEKSFKNKNIFEQSYGSSHSGGTLGAAGKDWMVDMPQAYVDYSNGPFWLRAGNQQIAWGEALFFRVSDMANGLDLRRHTILDVAGEEFSDKRVSSLALRGIYRLGEKTQFEGFVQQFRPTVISGENSPYNIVPAQFTLDQKTGYEDVKNKMNVGFRFQTSIENVGIQAFAINRHNPDGVIRWTYAKDAGALPGTPFSAGTGVGVYNAQEWFRYASSVRLDGLKGLASAVNEFSGTTAGGGFAGAMAAVGAGCGATGALGSFQFNQAAASCTLDSFFTAFGNLRGALVREYKRENVFGGGLNTVFSGEPDSLTDQLIGRFEFSYTPDKKFTNPTLSRKYIERDETTFAFIAEKYHKFSDSFPATYIVAQWMHKSDSDIYGRSMAGQNVVPGASPKGQSGGSNYLALVLQQPSPSLEWRFDMAVLTDTEGGLLVQPGAKWKPSKSLQLDIYGNYLNSSNSKGKTFTQGLDYAREVFLRGTYYF